DIMRTLYSLAVLLVSPWSGRVVFFFFFSSRRRHTRWPRDWSSDVCSSDLTGIPCASIALLGPRVLRRSAGTRVASPLLPRSTRLAGALGARKEDQSRHGLSAAPPIAISGAPRRWGVCLRSARRREAQYPTAEAGRHGTGPRPARDRRALPPRHGRHAKCANGATDGAEGPGR